jgi:glycosyltransferase involved in cell wall biosynthesis
MTEPLIVRQLMKDQIRWFICQGFDITIICNKKQNIEWILNQGAKHIKVDFQRQISLFHDIKSLLQLIICFWKNKFDLIHYSTPKASFLTPLAILMGFFKTRSIYTVRGRVYENYTGIKRKFFKTIDAFSCLIANKVIFISKEMMFEFIDSKIVKKSKAVLIEAGSSNGFNLNYFKKPSQIEKKNAKKVFKVQNFSKVLIYVGRISHDKGIEDLLYVYKKLKLYNKNIGLLLVGNLEMNLNKMLFQMNINKEKIKIFQWTDKIRDAFWASDILVFPSYREGFGNVCVESILCGVPVVSYNIIGCRESVKKNVSGYLVPFKDKKNLFEKVQKILFDSKTSKSLSKKGQIWARSNFDEKKIWNGIKKIYLDCYEQKSKTYE